MICCMFKRFAIFIWLPNRRWNDAISNETHSRHVNLFVRDGAFRRIYSIIDDNGAVNVRCVCVYVMCANQKYHVLSDCCSISLIQCPMFILCLFLCHSQRWCECIALPYNEMDLWVDDFHECSETAPCRVRQRAQLQHTHTPSPSLLLAVARHGRRR